MLFSLRRASFLSLAGIFSSYGSGRRTPIRLQSLPVASPCFEDADRRAALAGAVSTLLPFCLRSAGTFSIGTPDGDRSLSRGLPFARHRRSAHGVVRRLVATTPAANDDERAVSVPRIRACPR